MYIFGKLKIFTFESIFYYYLTLFLYQSIDFKVIFFSKYYKWHCSSCAYKYFLMINKIFFLTAALYQAF